MMGVLMKMEIPVAEGYVADANVLHLAQDVNDNVVEVKIAETRIRVQIDQLAEAVRRLER